MEPKRLAFFTSAALVVWALYLAWLWQPERQVRLHTAHFLGAIERQKWEKVDAFVADQYSDRWGHDKEIVLGALRQVFGQFIFLKIENEVRAPILTGDSARVEALVKMSGSGSPIADEIIARVNGLAGPFTFVWKQRSGKPWDWQLLSVDQPALEPGEMGL